MLKKTKNKILKIEHNLTKNEIKTICNQLSRAISLRFGTYVMSHEIHNSLGSIRADQLFIDFYNNYKDYPFYQKSKAEISEHDLDLSSSGIITFPWHKDRLEARLLDGRRSDFKWKCDDNHSVTLINPFDIYIVTGGNHSIFHGMFYSGGLIKCDSAIDYSEVLKEFDLT